MTGLVVVETHPVQYHAPVYRTLQQQFGIPTTAVYASDFSVAGYHDREFGASFAWDSDLLSGYSSVYLSRAAEGESGDVERPSAQGLASVLRQLSASAILLTGYSPRFYRAAFYHALRTGLPLLFRGETTDHALPRGPLKAAARDLLLRAAYGRYARLLYVGKRSCRHFLRLRCPRQKLVFSPYCVDTSVFATGEAARVSQRQAIRSGLGISDSQQVLLFSGKLSTRKGPDLLAQAVRRLPDAVRSKIVVVFLGDGELRESLEREVTEGATVDARFVGFHNQTEMGAFYHAADLLVLPSRRSETWGLVVNEALHHGVPCIVSDAVGCAPDLIEAGSTGEVFASDSVEGLRYAIERALRLVGRPEVRELCRTRVSSYTVEDAARGIAQAYQDVIR